MIDYAFLKLFHTAGFITAILGIGIPVAVMLNMLCSLGIIMMIIGGILLIIVTKSPSSSSPSPLNMLVPNVADTSHIKEWSYIGRYSTLIGIALVIIASLIGKLV